ncbi:MAG TPA: porin family protein [Flavobacterium sp.]
MALVLTSATATYAQNEADNTTDRSISFGVKGGVNFASISGDDIESPDSRTSFHVGGLVEFPLASIFSLQVEAMYSGKGFEYDNVLGDDGDHAELQLDYIDVPVLAKIYAFKGFSFEVGPQFSFLINEEFDYEPNSNGGDIELDDSEFEADNKFDFGVAGGVSFQTDMGLFASGRYTYGLTEIYENTDAMNSVFQISIGYKF